MQRLKIGVCVLITLLCFPLFAQNKEAEQYKIDSTLYVYYQRCLENNNSPLVLSMADTLFRMSGQKKDQRMQAVALSTALDYYYYRGMEDSIVAHVERVKSFAKATHQPKYYYFVWGDRLISFYIKNGKTNTALYEAEKMRKEAQEGDDKQGLANCYRALSNIYTLKKMKKQAYECLLQEVKLTESFQLNAYNLTRSYLEISDYCLAEKKQKEAFEALKKAEAASTSSFHKVHCDLGYVDYFLANDQFDMAEKYLKSASQRVSAEKKLYINRKSVFSATCKFYVKTKQYDKALTTLDSLQLEQQKLGEAAVNQENVRNRGEILLLLGKDKEAAICLRDYIRAKDSINAIQEQDAATEFATLLGLEKVNVEKRELELESHKAYLTNTRITIILLAGFLLILFAFLFREYHLNKKMKRSQEELEKKNKALIDSEDQLRLAKELAEQASQMKSQFIQNMTHEIRTPLNSIVGFSQILTSMFEEPETQDFANIIEENSNRLLKLIDDVLDLSDQETAKPLELTQTDINQFCRMSVESAHRHLHKGVTLDFQPGSESIFFQSHGERLRQILFNLIHNATRATLKGNITLANSLSADGKTLVITVTDTGIGIPPEKHEEIFERFAKLDDFTQGFGLGLPICRMLTQKLGGSIVIDKEYTEGCRFILTFTQRP